LHSKFRGFTILHMNKKTYTAPVIKSETIQVGVFGKYNNGNCNGNYDGTSPVGILRFGRKFKPCH
jgi:hypothetical protein